MSSILRNHLGKARTKAKTAAAANKLATKSVRITEKHYAPWVRSRQEQLEADLANAWSRDPLVLLQSGVHQRYTERSGPTTRSSSIRKTGARGGSRTHMRKNPRRILSPQRLPFRHPGTVGNRILSQEVGS